MNDLNDSHYIQDHALQVVRGVIAGRKVQPLNSAEMHFMGRKQTFLHIEKELGNDLIQVLMQWRQIMATVDLVDLLIEAHDAHSLDYLKEIFESAKENNMSLTKEQFYEVFDSAQVEKIPFGWAVNMLGEDAETSSKDSQTKSNAFSINSM